MGSSYKDILRYINPKNLWNVINQPAKQIKAADIKPPQTIPMARVAGTLFIRLAGLSGAAAVAMGAYGSHGFYPKKSVPPELKEVYKTANYYHFLHTLALLGVPHTRYPLLVGTLITTGMTIFCGTCYAYALTGNVAITQYTPYGGTLLIIAWLSMVL